MTNLIRKIRAYIRKKRAEKAETKRREHVFTMCYDLATECGSMSYSPADSTKLKDQQFDYVAENFKITCSYWGSVTVTLLIDGSRVVVMSGHLNLFPDESRCYFTRFNAGCWEEHVKTHHGEKIRLAREEKRRQQEAKFVPLTRDCDICQKEPHV